ncbi:amino acid adenylation domain protein [Fibrella aestuarina BUZ 2]|uniref:Amino acid adenylation domain protein n=1 Tax=Fibrella aestuarina BUZ 2 TaxID=1166018 RepID=I0K3L4_9BACT|nr:type I polyketide synthase [Fibrella aestuarina]CCG98717.1 amino acid adenylation domain protein [Fibrella aestuarina BUZ 2]
MQTNRPTDTSPFSATTRWFAEAQQVHQLVEAMASRYPEQPAVVIEGASQTYAELNEVANRIASQLLRQAPEAPVIGIDTTRRLSLVSQLLGILKAGKAYLPLDPTYPASRLRQLIDNAHLTHCLTDGAQNLYGELGLSVVRTDEETATDAPNPLTRTPYVCVLYTSGSTGVPKGVCLGHAGLIDLLRWEATQGPARPGSRTLQFCHLSFDASFQEIFLPLSTGGTVYLIDDSYRLDAGRLLRFMVDNAINRVFLPYVVLQYLCEAAEAQSLFPASLEEIITGGERLRITPQIRRFFTELPTATLMNVYGPTETSVWVTQYKLTGDAPNWPKLPPIGAPIANAEVLILSDTLTLLPDGEVGEVCIGGPPVALGYLNQPERTAERFIQWQHPEKGTLTLYRTGDLARYVPDDKGTRLLDFQGRADDQVKIRGNRVELGEIEVALAHLPDVQQAVAVALENEAGLKRIVAYVLMTPGQQANVADMRANLAATMPDFMLPAHIIELTDLPRTTSGKVDKLRLPKPESTRPALGTLFREPVSEQEKTIAAIWAELLQISPIGLDDNFFELGGNSLLAQKTVAQLAQRGQTLPITKLYQYPTVAGLATYLSGQGATPQKQSRQPTAARRAESGDVAIIGMAGRFPGADSVADLWDVLAEGRETVTFFTPEQIDSSIPVAVRTNPGYVRARGIIASADQFDPAFFGITPALAEMMDPQQRIFLEIAYEVLEQTGYLPQVRDEIVGVYAGSGNNTYFLNNVLPNPAQMARVGAFQAMTVNEKDYIATRTSYQLNLTGPAVSVYSACSTSLLAIAQAVESLRNGQCTVALAGGACITAPIHSGHLYEDGAMMSRDGHCRSFDADAQGTVFSDGAGVVLLKPLADAQRDGDPILAIIKGVGVNNDGGGKGSFTAPSAEGQAAAIRNAHLDGQIDPATISYVEAHGTGTPLGDPIEIDGLRMAFGEQPQRQFCAIGSLKSNMGHLSQAAGVAGVIKTVLAMQHRQLPPSLNFNVPNPAIDFGSSPFYVNDRLTDWNVEGPLRAGVSSFGVGGTNVHVVLEEAGSTGRGATGTEVVQTQSPAFTLLTWSAKSDASTAAYAEKLADALATADVVDVAYTMATTRPAYAHRQFAVVSSRDAIDPALLTKTPRVVLKQQPGEVAFVFPGQGAQYLNMGRAFYEQKPVYRQAVDACAALLEPYLDVDIRTVLFSDDEDLAAKELLKNTRYTQPALFVTNYALAQLWQSWGIEPTVFCGHSIGEFVAAHLAGVFSLADALQLVATRGQLVSACPRGSMLSVRLSAADVAPLLPETLSLAAINSHSLCVVAGPDEDIAALAQRLDKQQTPNRVLQTSHAFHSAMMDPVVDAFRAVVEKVQVQRPQKPVVSTVTGTWLTDAQATDPVYWAKHLRETVRFADALDTLFELRQPVLLEVGPGFSSTTLARQQAGTRTVVTVASLHRPTPDRTEEQAILMALGTLWQQGLTPNWDAVFAGSGGKRIPLPTYPFNRKRCWIDSPAGHMALIPTQMNVTLPTDEPIAPSSTNVPITNSDTTHTLVIPAPTDVPTPMRSEHLLDKIKTLLEDASGIDLVDLNANDTFLELGLDSLLLTQISISLRSSFGVPISFRQLSSELDTPQKVADYLDTQLPAETHQPAPAPAPVPPMGNVPTNVPTYGTTSLDPMPALPGGDSALGLIAQQLQLLARQVALMQGGMGQGAGSMRQGAATYPTAVSPAPTTPVPPLPPTPPAPRFQPAADITPEEAVELKKPFGATARIERQKTDNLTPKQQQFLADLTQTYNAKTAGSKAYTQKHRAQMADPRVVSGFRPQTKELVYPIVIKRSKGSKLWDVDGNEYIDALNGFGATMFGHQPDFIKEALHAQVENGFEVGPQHELAGEVCELFCDMTNNERAALCSTGSEAVLGTMRIARTITGRSLIVAFTGSYHGIVDEVLVRGTKKLKSFPAAAGIMPESVQNMLILDYGTDESLRIIRERAHELAAVLVEPVQSRRAEFQPVAFLKEVRAITEASGTALIFDEVITGFRMHPGGAQALFGIQADLASYGKVVGGGLPIGIIAGKKSFMDALDGGFWEYGDESIPEVGVTYFAGTFVRHPLALASAKASLLHLKEKGPALQKTLTRHAETIAESLNAAFTRLKLPLFAAQFGSLWRLKWTEDVPYGELLFTLMRQKGIHIWDGFPCFVTEAHTEAELAAIRDACIDSANELIRAGFFPMAVTETTSGAWLAHQPPVPGARLGRDQQGNPAWFVPDPDQPGKYRQLEIA